MFFFCFFLSRSLGRSSPNLEGRWTAAPDISLRGVFLKGQGHRGQNCHFFLFSSVYVLFEIVCVCVCMCVSYYTPPLKKSAGYYVIPSKKICVRVSVRPSVCPSVRLSVRPSAFRFRALS